MIEHFLIINYSANYFCSSVNADWEVLGQLVAIMEDDDKVNMELD